MYMSGCLHLFWASPEVHHRDMLLVSPRSPACRLQTEKKRMSSTIYDKLLSGFLVFLHKENLTCTQFVWDGPFYF